MKKLLTGHEVIIEAFAAGNAEHQAKFASLTREWLEEYGFLEPFDEKVMADPEGEILKDDGLILFAVGDGRIVGTGALIAHGSGVYEIAKMGVTKKWRGRGVGRVLTEALIEAGRARKAHMLKISSNRKLESAVRLYHALGFRDVAGDTDSRYARCDIMMEMLLPQEFGGREGPDPTRYSDWEKDGRCVDF